MLKKLSNLEEGIAGLLFIAGVFVSLYGVFTRYILNMPQAWVTEIFELLIVWSIFLGFGIALKENRHISVEILFDRLSYKAKMIINCISNCIGAGFAFFLMFTSIKLVTLTRVQGTETVDVGIPIWITLLVLPISMGLLGLYFIRKAYRSAKGDKKELTGEVEELYEEIEQQNRENHNKGVSL